MRQANGTGSIFKLAGNRRKPYAVMVTVRTEYDEASDTYKLKRKYLGYFASQKEARQCLAEYNASNISADAYSLTLDDIWKLARVKRLQSVGSERAGKIEGNYQNHIFRFSNMIFREMKADDVQRIIDECPSLTIKRELKGILHSCYEYAIKNDIIQKDYSDYIEIESYSPKIQRNVISDKVRDLEAAPPCLLGDIVLILLYTGCRSREILAKTTIFDLESKTITIPEAKNRTSKRTIPIHDRILEVVERYAATPNRPVHNTLYLWTTERGFTPHDCRHTFATRAHECRLDDLTIQKLLGHSPETITQSVYTHITIEDMRRELSKFHY